MKFNDMYWFASFLDDDDDDEGSSSWKKTKTAKQQRKQLNKRWASPSKLARKSKKANLLLSQALHTCAVVPHTYIDSDTFSCILYRRHHSPETELQCTTPDLYNTCWIAVISLCIYTITRTITAIPYYHQTTIQHKHITHYILAISVLS